MEKQPSFNSMKWSDAPKCDSMSGLKAVLLEQFGVINEAQSAAFLNPKLSDLASPWDIIDIKPAAERIRAAIIKGERIMILGDFDADGVTSTALLVDGLQQLGATVSYRIPDRVTDSHGLKLHHVQEIAAKGVQLLITCDCGTNDKVEVAAAVAAGMDVIITDHHASDPDRFPTAAVAVVNPQRKESQYAFRDLAGIGVVFHVLSVVAESILSEAELPLFLEKYLELVAIGTIADCMPLVGENRILVKWGIRQMQTTQWPGLRHMLEGIAPITEETVSFHIAPRINAASRIGNVLHAVQLFLLEEGVDDRLSHLEVLNEKRKKQTHRFIQAARKQMITDGACVALLLKDCPAGIAGLVAGRLSEEQNQPAVIMTILPDGTVGASCRAPNGYDMEGALRSCPDLFVHFGGHAGAAGFRADLENVSQIQKALEVHFAGISQPQNALQISAEISPELLTHSLLEFLSFMSPFGVGAARPTFRVKNYMHGEAVLMGIDKNHIRIMGSVGEMPIKATAFFKGEWNKKITPGEKYDLVVSVYLNVWKSNTSIDIRVIDICLHD